MNSNRTISIRRLLASLRRAGWRAKRRTMEHRNPVTFELPGTISVGLSAGTGGVMRVLVRTGFVDYVVAFPDKERIGPVMLARIAKHTGIAAEAF